MREKQNPVEKEWAAVVKAEARFLRHAMPARTAGWQEKITRYVPQKLEATLHTAFYKAFELIFDKGTPVIEKTCQKEKKEQNYKINAYAAEVRDTRHALRERGGCQPEPESGGIGGGRCRHGIFRSGSAGYTAVPRCFVEKYLRGRTQLRIHV